MRTAGGVPEAGGSTSRLSSSGVASRGGWLTIPSVIQWGAEIQRAPSAFVLGVLCVELVAPLLGHNGIKIGHRGKYSDLNGRNQRLPMKMDSGMQHSLGGKFKGAASCL